MGGSVKDGSPHWGHEIWPLIVRHLAFNCSGACSGFFLLGLDPLDLFAAPLLPCLPTTAASLPYLLYNYKKTSGRFI